MPILFVELISISIWVNAIMYFFVFIVIFWWHKIRLWIGKSETLGRLSKHQNLCEEGCMGYEFWGGQQKPFSLEIYDIKTVSSLL